MSKNMNYTQEILDYFNMTAKAFSEHSGISQKTIEGWKSKGVDGLGLIALENIKKVEEQKRDFVLKNKELIEKCEDFDRLLEIQKKYSR